MVNNYVRLNKESKNTCQSSPSKVQMARHIVVALIFLGVLCLVGCNPGLNGAPKPDPMPTTTFNEDGSINVYIEIPAGSNVKNEINKNFFII